MSAALQLVDTPRRRAKFGMVPDAMFKLPDDKTELTKQVLDIIEICRSDAGARTAYYRQLNAIIELGKSDGTRSLLNLLYSLVDRLASHLFSPTEIRFTMDFENEYGKLEQDRGAVAARLLARSWERDSTDILFAAGVFEALKFGFCALKQGVRTEGQDRLPVYTSSLVMPWQLGVYKPTENNLDKQPAIVETVILTLPEVWRRIWHMPDAQRLYAKIAQNAAPATSSDIQDSFFHQVLSTAPINTSGITNPRPTPGGVVQLSVDPNFTGVGATSTAPTVRMHEVWMWGEDDYVTVQIIEPDILIAPLFKKSNLLIPGVQSGVHPYQGIQPNQTTGSIWGRSEITDLIAPQDWVSQTADDIKRLLGVQFDKLFGISGDDISVERYDQMRSAGYMTVTQGASIQDLTPRLPPEGLPILDKIIQLIEMISGFDNMLSGRGEPGVRSGSQSNPMMKAAGARMRDRSLIVERQCAAAADTRLSLMEAKDGRNYWTDPENKQATSFLLSDLPDDRRVMVDGHTTSPIFADDNASLLIGGLKLGIVDPVSAIEGLPFQNRDTLLTRLRAKEKAAAETMERLRRENPEEWAKLIEKQAGGGRRR